MLRYLFHRALGHRVFTSDVARARRHCYTCDRHWGRQPRWNR